MRGTWQTEGGGGQLATVAGGAAAIGAVIWLVLTFLWVIAAIVGVALVLVAAGLVWLARHGGEVATVTRAALPPPEAAPVTARPVQALPAPQTVTNNYFYGVTPEQVADAIARQQRAVEGR